MFRVADIAARIIFAILHHFPSVFTAMTRYQPSILIEKLDNKSSSSPDNA